MLSVSKFAIGAKIAANPGSEAIKFQEVRAEFFRFSGAPPAATAFGVESASAPPPTGLGDDSAASAGSEAVPGF